MGVTFIEAGASVELPSADLLVDGIIGYSLQDSPTGPAAALINAANVHGAPILALDVPSGVDTATGTVREPAIRATATLTLALPKQGLRGTEALDRVGELFLADIGVPPELYARPPLALTVGPVFAEDEIVRLW
jgi:NAD(P)H-hydrate epimerase